MVIRSPRWLVIGTPGAERIFATLSLFLVDLIDRGLPTGEAIGRARLHCEPEGLVHIEGNWRNPGLAAYLRAAGSLVEERDPLSYFFGGVHAVMRCRSRKELHGAADLRRNGSAQGV